MKLDIETETCEYKKTTGELNDSMKDICAILNKHGQGVLYFGVKPNGEVCGLQVTESTLRDVSRKISECIEPKIYPTIEKIKLSSKSVIKVTFAGNMPPYAAKGVHYMRTADESRIMSEGELVNFIRGLNYSENWENQITNYDYKEIDEKSLNDFYIKATSCGRLSDVENSKKALISALNLGRNGKLNNAGLYLFGKNTKINLKLSVFATDEKITFLDLKEISGNIFNLVDEAIKYVFANIRWKIETSARTRNEIPEIPEKAIREIIINSFAHAQYESSTEHEINIFPNSVAIYNPGTFPMNLTPLDFVNTNRSSIIRNKIIADVLFRSKDVEKSGSGFKRVYSLCNEQNIKCDFTKDDFGFKFIFERNSDNARIENDKHYINSQNNDLTDFENAVLEIIKENPKIKKFEIATKLSKSEKTIQRTLNLLQDKKVICRNGNYKSGFWEVMFSFN